MKVWIWSSVALSLAVLGASRPAQALKCTNDIDCPCGDVCSWATQNHTCVTATAGGDPGWCSANADCLYTGQTCKGTSCTPAWSDTSVCVNATTDAGPDEDAGSAASDAGEADAGSDDAGAATDAGSSDDAGTNEDAGTTEDAGSGPGSDAGIDAGAGEGTTGGTSTGGTTTGGTTTGGTTTGGSTGASCTNDVDCDCGQVCSWAPPNDVNHVCVSASTGDPGWCSGSDSDCLYAGQSCSGTSCTPAWSESSVCTKGSGSTSGGSTTGGGTTGGGTTGGSTTGSTGPVCTNDIDCDCGQVCSWAHAATGCETGCGNCVDASGGDPGWCSGSDSDCLYSGQSCDSVTCKPLWNSSDVCLKGEGTTGGTTGGAGTTGGGTAGSATTGEGSTTGAPEGTTGGASTSGASGSGTTTGSETGPSSGGGCSSAGGSFALVIGVLALGLLTRKRRDV